ncbi:T9SS type A sorting domain-containing protein [Hymenobacter sp. BT175]|uniref:FG-GAP-like repeat-containing protein n=1 Tax=Hymenobacter translucens TaxID=2886507 RepID=UPI001D0ED81F|nr:FG-GAP-like repeat-containing protein [Hymenobacter translucens]MCC2547129.1 T9SS type A sorting domain-containing protein [Hymenobacter translucens]
MLPFYFSARTLRILATVALGALLPAAVLAQAPTIASVNPFNPSAGPSGTTVVITGTNLLLTSTVLLNGQTMPISARTATTVTVTVPVAANSGRVRVTTPGGTALSTPRFLVQRASSGSTASQVGTGSVNSIDIGAYSTPTATDLDGDGLVDMLVGTDAGTIIRYEQYPVGNANYPGFITPGTTLTANTTSAPTTFGTLDVGNFAKPTVTDLDGDGLLDLLVGEGTGTVLRFEQTAAGSTQFNAFGAITTATTVASGTGLGQYVKPTIADIDGNGLLDMLVGGESGRILRYEQTAANSGSFTLIGNLTTNGTNVIDSGVTANGVSKPQIIDFDGDGLLDLLIGNVDGFVQRYEQTAINSTNFTLVGNLTNGTSDLDVGGYAAPAVADLDGDGILDLFIGNTDGTVLRYEQAAAAPNPLPVKLTAFSGQAAANANELRWTTAQEVNSAAFVVERSADGALFSAVGEVAAAGNSTAARSYTYFDAPATGTRYYRLRMVDLDGTTAYSPIVALGRAAAAAAAYPNPFAEVLNVALPAGDAPQPATVMLLTLTGRAVYSQKLELSAVPRTLPALPALAPGIYLLRLTTAAGTTTQRLTRN